MKAKAGASIFSLNKRLCFIQAPTKPKLTVHAVANKAYIVLEEILNNEKNDLV